MVLQQVGNVKYISWCLTIPCSPELIPELRKLHSLMQRELEEWRQAVRRSREYHYELNYFSTPQLLTLRKALGHSAASSAHLINSQVLALLHSISPHISIQSTTDALKREVESGATVQKYNSKQKKLDCFHPVASGIQSVSQPKRKINLQNRENSCKAVGPNSTIVEISGNSTREEINKRTITANVGKLFGKQYGKLVPLAFNEGLTDQIEIENWVRDNDDLLDDESEEEEVEKEEEENDDEEKAYVSFEEKPLRQSNTVPCDQKQSSKLFINFCVLNA